MASWYVRKGGSDNDGGSSAGTSPDRSGTDMGTTNGSTQVTSASASFAAGDVGKGINIAGVIYRIATFTNSTTIQLERNYAGTTGSNRTWAIGGALATFFKLPATAAAVMQGGDTLYVGPGQYAETGTFALTSPSSDITITGDPDGSHTGDAPGEVIISAFTSGDTTAAASATTINLGGKNHIVLQKMTVIGGVATPSCITLGTTCGTNVTVQDVALNGLRTDVALGITTPAGVASTVVIDRVRIVSGLTTNAADGAVVVTANRHSADYDVGVTIQNSLVIGGGAAPIWVVSTGSGTGKGGGVKVLGCTLYGGGGVRVNDANISTTIPCVVSGCLLLAGGNSNALYATTSGQISEDHNMLVAGGGSRNNVTAGTGSNTGPYDRSPRLQLGQELVVGASLRPFLMPAASSPALGFGTGSGPAYDLLNRTRPAGGASPSYAAGCYERGNTWAKNTATVHTGSNALSITGPGYQEFLVPVSAAATTISVFFQYDSTYAGTRPQIQIDANPEIGVSAETVTVSTSALNAYAQASLSQFTPTAAGLVRVRLISNDTNGAGKAFADTFAVA